jgi:hypothetical protein
MPKEYDYSTKYEEKNPNIKFRRCKNCQKIKKVEHFEIKFICSACYPSVRGKKRCNNCSLRRPIEYFVKGKTKKIATKDGYLNYCNFCLADYRKKSKK